MTTTLPSSTSNSEGPPNAVGQPFYMPGENQDPISRFSADRMHRLTEPPCKSSQKNPGGGINGEYIYSKQKIYDLEVAKANHRDSMYGKEKYGLKPGSDGVQEMLGMMALNPPIKPFGPMTKNNLFFSNWQKQAAYGVEYPIWETPVASHVTINSTDVYEKVTTYDVFDQMNTASTDYLKKIRKDLLEIGEVRKENQVGLDYSGSITEVGPAKETTRELNFLPAQVMLEQRRKAYADLAGNIIFEE
jgi:hypothetical protein